MLLVYLFDTSGAKYIYPSRLIFRDESSVR